MARNAGPRTVQCYHCGHRLEVGGRTQSTNCPGCNNPVRVEDFVYTGHNYGNLKIQTCGKIIVKKKATLSVTQLIEAHGGIECHGRLEAKTIISGKPVIMHKTSQWRGDLTAPGCVMHAGAKVQPSMFNVPADPLGLADLPERE